MKGVREKNGLDERAHHAASAIRLFRSNAFGLKRAADNKNKPPRSASDAPTSSILQGKQAQRSQRATCDVRDAALTSADALIAPAGQRFDDAFDFPLREQCSQRIGARTRCAQASESKSHGSKPSCAQERMQCGSAESLFRTWRRHASPASWSSSRMSSALSTSLAPCLMRSWQPLASGEWIEPGIAKTSLPCSFASAR